MNRLDKSRGPGIIVEDPPELRNRVGQRLLIDDNLAPDHFKESISRYHLARTARQARKDVHDPWLDLDGSVEPPKAIEGGFYEPIIDVEGLNITWIGR